MIVGTYTPPHGAGSGLVRVDATNRTPLAALDSPSWVARHPSLPLLYAVAEHRGELVVVDERSGAIVQDGVPAGEAACHVRVADDGRSAIVACWGDGQVLRYALDAAGRVTGHEAAPPMPEPGSRAHASIAFGDGFVTTDLGLDVLRVWRGDGFDEVQRLALPDGSGPRHLVAHGDRLYVDTEYSNEILVIARDGDGMLTVAARAPIRVGGMVEGDSAAEIALDPTGAWLTVGVRGSNVIAVSRRHPDGSTEPVSEAPSGGDWPRHHVHDGDGILVAHERSSTIVRLPFDAATGTVGTVAATLEVGSPTMLLRDRDGVS